LATETGQIQHSAAWTTVQKFSLFCTASGSSCQGPSLIIVVSGHPWSVTREVYSAGGPFRETITRGLAKLSETPKTPLIWRLGNWI